MHLKLSSCAIRSLTEHDVESLQRYADNRNIWLNLRDIFPHPYRLENARGFVTFAANQKPEANFAIAAGSELIGCIGLTLGTDVHRKTAELGYWLAEPFWGRGIMSEAVVGFSRYSFNAFDLVRIHAQPFAKNLASARVLEKAGFVCEGTLRANALKNGEILDTLMYSLVRSDEAKNSS